MNRLLTRAERLLTDLERLTGERGPVASLLGHTDRLLTDERIDKLLTSLERLTDEKKLGRILDDVSALSGEASKIGPEIPEIAEELTTTLRETTILLKALQRLWILEGIAREVREDMQERR